MMSFWNSGSLGKVKMVRDNEHTCLGMKFIFGNKKVIINVVEHALAMLKEFPMEFETNDRVSAPAGLNKFDSSLPTFAVLTTVNAKMGNGKKKRPTVC